ncbi:protein POLAR LOCALIZATION DURING ASYMMETRIC DIVISION AND REDISTRIBUTION isoform X2 [Vigna radiata var. radiata]|uniref:Protein POLAR LOCALIZATION DURING ASYMMETRIC DIVISION AND REDISTRIBUTION isoform X2 n=1 Tax=Vigna radiata var. radiata TaxID=3916 RepID=A0A1S3U2J7_VIGRR|nr:protein POLAR LOCALIZATION DURING ASYMMETRIC DIVISION AND REDISTRIBUTION isoform X2 [Vigna radiata var. radiata]
MSTKQKHLFLKSPNLKFNPVVHSHSLPRRLRIADILLADQDHDGVDCMDAFRETSTKKCFSPLRLVESLLAPLRPAKGFRLQQRRQNETGELNTAPAPTNELKGSDDSIENPGRLHESDTSFKLGVGCGLLYLLAASKNELGKMVELRKEMEVLLQNMKDELQRKDALLKPLKQNDALALSITDIQEVSSSDSHISIHSQTQYVQPESKRNMVPNNFLEYDISEQGECAEEINDLQAEFEIELQRLQLYLDGETEFEDAKHEGVKVTVKDCSSKSSHSSSFGEITMEPIGASYDVSFGVSPIELERRLHELLEARLEERITELEYGLECTTQKLIKKEIEATWWKDTARLLSQHVPETSRFTFPLDPEIAVNLSKFVG